MSHDAFLADVSASLSTEFEQNRRVMSFEDYLDVVANRPNQQVRSAAQYLVDCFDHWGKAAGPRERFRLFDTPWDAGRERVVGQEDAQLAIYQLIKGFTAQRRVNKLVLLHGPNGSAKSSMLACIGRALEAYSRTDDGALYCFSWVFPTDKASGRRLGFGESAAEDTATTFAGLADDKIEARIASDLRDHPLLLLPMAHRQRFLEQHAPAERLSGVLARGELSPRNQTIAERLFASYRGDLKKLLRHVQVERFYISRRYRRGAVTVEPQMHIDASVRQLTADRSLSSLPLALQSATLYEPVGDLVDANRGIIEYNDLLKRPLDTWKYLLATCEKSTVALSNQILHLDLVMLASSNELHLAAFKEHPDWPSFKGRIELVRVPYLRSWTEEKRIYDEQVAEETPGRLIGPHATTIAALWAVLTRLRLPIPAAYPAEASALVGSLTPLQKADLYALGRAPAGMPLEKARLLRNQVSALLNEEREDGEYEGQTGASPREVKALLLTAAQRTEFTTLSPLAVLTEIRELCRLTSVYGFLKLEKEGAYRDPIGLIDVVRGRWLDLASDDLFRALGLVTREQYDDLFRRYLVNVSHSERNEKLMNPVTGRLEEPDAVLMKEMERDLAIDKEPREFRRDLLGRVGAASQAGPIKPGDYRELFPQLFDTLEASYYQRQLPIIRKVSMDMVRVLANDSEALPAADRRRAQESLERLKTEAGYDDASAHEALSTLLAERIGA